jgi:hypothetical protein
MPDFTGGQFPSLDGRPEDEVTQRTEAPTEGNWFTRVFTVHNRNHTRDLPADHESHLANFASTLQDALQRGLHPKAAPELVSETDHPVDPNSTDLTYRVPVVPAVADEEPETTVTPGVLGQALAQSASPAPATAQELTETVQAPAPKKGTKTASAPSADPAPAETTAAPSEAPETPSEPTE